MKKVLLFINSLRGGSVGRMAVDFANELANYCEVTVQTLSDEGAFKKELNDSVIYKSIVPNKAFKKIRKYFIAVIMPPSFVHDMYIGNQYDYEIAFGEGVPTKIIGASSNKNSIKYAWIHSNFGKNTLNGPKSEFKQSDVFSSLYKEIRCYENFNKIICASKSSKENFLNRYQIEDYSEDNLIVKHCFIDTNSLLEKAEEEFPRTGRFRIVTVGRLEMQKGHERLLWVIKKLVNEGIDCELIIVGEGKRHDELEGYIKYNGLKKRVLMTGFSDNPYKYIKSADLCVFPVKNDSYGTAAVESVILGKPVIISDCKGVRDLLGDSEYGVISDNSDHGLYECIKKMITDDEYRMHYEEKAKERAKYFSKDARLKDLSDLFEF